MEETSTTSALKVAATERRQHVRRPLRGAARLFIPGRPPVALRLMDVSVGGLGVVSALNLPVKTAGVVQFQVPAHNGLPKACECRVVIAMNVFSNAEDGFKLGLQFVGLKSEQTDLIAAYVGG